MKKGLSKELIPQILLNQIISHLYHFNTQNKYNNINKINLMMTRNSKMKTMGMKNLKEKIIVAIVHKNKNKIVKTLLETKKIHKQEV